MTQFLDRNAAREAALAWRDSRLSLTDGRRFSVDTRPLRSHTAGMTSEKIAVSLPRPLAQQARRAVRQGRASSVSAYVAAALEEKVKLDELSRLLQDMLAESGGPLSAAERRTADRALGAPAATRRRR